MDLALQCYGSRMSKALYALRLLLPLALLCVAATSERYVQPDLQFKAAFDNHSSSPSFVMIDVVDGQSGLEKTGCITPATLIHAIEIERNMAPVYSFTGPSAKIALAASTHRFTFEKQETLSAIGFVKFEMNDAEACHIIRSGRPAFQADRTAQILVGQP